MKMYVRILVTVLCAALVLLMPFVLSAPNLLSEVKWTLLEEMEDNEIGLLRLLAPAARAEEAEAEPDAPVFSLPIDFTPGYAPNPACYTEEGYEDASIRVRMETREEKDTTYRIAWVEIASPSQLRTAIAGKTVKSTLEAKVIDMAAHNNAVVAINGDYFTHDPHKTTFEYRMGEKVRSNTNQQKDILLIDDQGDFHLVMAQKTEDQKAALQALLNEYTIVNAFTFGPALVKDGESLTMRKDYGYEPNGRTARTAIGQLDTLRYVMVVAEGKEKPERGVTHQQLADFMYSLGCRDAFNLDGGGSSYMFWGDPGFTGPQTKYPQYYNVMMAGHRDISDIIYFATAVPSGE